MCGVAGSGKTTYAQRLEAAGYVRLSIDEEVWARFGRYGVDYDPDRYAEYSERAEATLRQRLHDLIDQGRNVVVDFSFWERRNRDRYKKLIEGAGGRWRLVYLQVPADVLRRRLDRRNRRFDANAAFPIHEPTLTRYLGGFEAPAGEGEEVVTVVE
jgi:predicted kinase